MTGKTKSAEGGPTILRLYARATVYGYAVYQCGGVYYQAFGGGYVVVTFQ